MIPSVIRIPKNASILETLKKRKGVIDGSWVFLSQSVVDELAKQFKHCELGEGKRWFYNKLEPASDGYSVISLQKLEFSSVFFVITSIGCKDIHFTISTDYEPKNVYFLEMEH